MSKLAFYPSKATITLLQLKSFVRDNLLTQKKVKTDKLWTAKMQRYFVLLELREIGICHIPVQNHFSPGITFIPDSWL